MSDPRECWKIVARCRNCGAEFEAIHPAFSVSTVRTDDSELGRLVLIGVPEVCPQCHNLKAVK